MSRGDDQILQDLLETAEALQEIVAKVLITFPLISKADGQSKELCSMSVNTLRI